ncbi:MAG: hypothetical protein HYY20_11875 [Candidatus Tectomicrobia bacterium]|uniref:Uncharacterized protein n=1 Tax=Tectimicrobiota bacterium TaxID=2528274 RepID=A0A932CQE1_UNCTE|nr:hypothetical protein [Candidatus Tectomicrobia bacterium]
MRRDLIELLTSYKLLTDSEEKKRWREWAFSNTEFDGEWEYQEFHEALEQIDQGLQEGVA